MGKLIGLFCIVIFTSMASAQYSNQQPGSGPVQTPSDSSQPSGAGQPAPVQPGNQLPATGPGVTAPGTAVGPEAAPPPVSQPVGVEAGGTGSSSVQTPVQSPASVQPVVPGRAGIEQNPVRTPPVLPGPTPDVNPGQSLEEDMAPLPLQAPGPSSSPSPSLPPQEFRQDSFAPFPETAAPGGIALAPGYGATSPGSTSAEIDRGQNQGAYVSDVEAHLNRYDLQVEDLQMRAQDLPPDRQRAVEQYLSAIEKKSDNVRGMLNDLDSGVPRERAYTRDRIDRAVGDLERSFQNMNRFSPAPGNY